MPTSARDRRDRFRRLHERGLFIMPNAWDIGSARILASMGFEALATTSLGHAAALGKLDLTVTRDEMLDHVETLASAVDLPLNVDAQRCFADHPAGVAETVAEMAARGAAGCSIEDYDPATGRIDPLDVAVERVTAAAEEAHRHGVVLTARAENHVYDLGDLDDTVQRLIAYRQAGADVVYAPRLSAADDIRRVVDRHRRAGQRAGGAQRPIGARARGDGRSSGLHRRRPGPCCVRSAGRGRRGVAACGDIDVYRRGDDRR